MTVKVTRTAQAAGGQLTLQDLIDLVNACQDFPKSAKLSITASRDFEDGNYYSITVTEP